MSVESWQAAAARSFCSALPSPAVAGAQSTRAYRDIKGWIAGLVHAVHAVRWAALAASVEQACRSSCTLRVDEATCAVTRAIIELVVVRQPDESRRIVTSNARRQCARKDGRLSLIRLVDLALALANLRRVLASPSHSQNDYAVATQFWNLVHCFRGLRAVHEMDDTARSIDLYLFDSSWADEHTSPDVFALDHSINSNNSNTFPATSPIHSGQPAGPLSVAVTSVVNPIVIERAKKTIRFAVARASRSPSVIDYAPPSNLFGNGFNIITAAFTADFDPARALSIADHCASLTPSAVARVRDGCGPLPLKDLRQTLFCQLVMKAVPPANIATIVQKLAQLFVPVGWHRGGSKSEPGLKWLNQCAEGGNFSAEAVLGRQMAESGNMAGKHYLRSAEQKGDVAAPIILGDLYRDGNSFIAPNVALAKQYYLTAIERGSALAALNLGTMYLDKKFPGSASETRKSAAKLFQTSVDRGNARAALALGNLLFEKAPDCNPDFDRAERCYSIAVDKTTIALVRLHAKYGLARVALEKLDVVKGVEALEHVLLDTNSPKTCCDMEDSQQRNELDTFRRLIYKQLGEVYQNLSSRGHPVLINQQCLTAQELRDKAWTLLLNATEIDNAAGDKVKEIEGREKEDERTEANSEAWFKLGLLRLQTKDLTGAGNALWSALHAGHTQAAHVLGKILVEQNKKKDALEVFEISASRNNDGKGAINAAMVAMEDFKDRERAKRMLELAVKFGEGRAAVEVLKISMRADNKSEIVGEAKELAELAEANGLGRDGEEIRRWMRTEMGDKIRDGNGAGSSRGKRKRRGTTNNGALRRRTKRRTERALHLHDIGPLPVVERNGWGGIDLQRWASECISARYWRTWIDLSGRNCGKRCMKNMTATVLENKATRGERKAVRRALRRLIEGAKKVTMQQNNRSMLAKLYKWGTPKPISGEAVLKCALFNTPHPAVRIERRLHVDHENCNNNKKKMCKIDNNDQGEDRSRTAMDWE